MDQSSYQVKNIYKKCKKDKSIVSVPGSKSITNRALLLATLAKGETLLKGALFSDDSRYFLQCIRALGFTAEADEEEGTIRVVGLGGKIPKEEASVYVGSAGTAARFLAAFLGMSKGVFHMDASEQMRKRPMKPLLDRLEALGAQITYEGEEGHFPFTIVGCGVKATEVSVDIEHSSQFLSALLISACLAPEGMRITAEGEHGMAYVDMTVRMMEEFGITCRQTDMAEDQEGWQSESEGSEERKGTRDPNKESEDQADQQSLEKMSRSFVIPAGERYCACEYEIEPDASAAAYFYAMAAILGTSVVVRGVHFDGLQGDVEFLRILEQMGCTLEETGEGVCLTGPENGKLKGITADMHRCSDQAITLAAIAPFADAPVTITGIGHIRYQESNRIAAIVTELRRMGIACKEFPDGVAIQPGIPESAKIETYDDHRMAMGFTLTGLRAEGIEILDPGCCKKTFENYFAVLDAVVETLVHG